jgi:uncharacterized repeat protein (TIGR03803 family)
MVTPTVVKEIVMTTRPRFTFHLPLPAFALVMFVVLTMIATQPAQAQTYTVLHYFTGGGDGSAPVSGLTMAGPGNFYGTAAYGGYEESGTIFNLRQVGSGWILTPLYTFHNLDGSQPEAAPTIGPDGNLYGTTFRGGSSACVLGCGIVYKLTPPANFCRSTSCPWTETVLHYFYSTDGAYPGYGKLIFDRSGNLYGTTGSGGANGLGTVFELTPSNGSWTETVLYSFSSDADGYLPYSGVIFDSTGNLYGTTQNGGPNGNGTVYELSPTGSGWTKSILLSFGGGNQGGGPRGGVIMDAQGNLYGSTASLGPQGGGTAYQLSPSNGQWNYTLLAGLPAAAEGPWDSPTLDAAGNVYLTSYQALGNGAVVEVTPSDGGWQLNTLHAFSGSDGAWPTGSVILDASGNIYGTASIGGNDNNGVIFEITP